MRLRGAGLDWFDAVPGADSLQALLLALDIASHVVAEEVGRMRGVASWLTDSERVILARHALSKGAETAIVTLLGHLKHASRVLDSGSPSSAAARDRALRALQAIADRAGMPAPVRRDQAARKRRPR